LRFLIRLTAIEWFGILRGSWFAARRLLRCHPWNPGGVDHVPHLDPEHMSGDPTQQTWPPWWPIGTPV